MMNYGLTQDKMEAFKQFQGLSVRGLEQRQLERKTLNSKAKTAL